MFPSWSWVSLVGTKDLDYLLYLDQFSWGRSTKFRQDESTLKSTTSLVTIEMQTLKGTKLSWATQSKEIMDMASTQRRPPKLLCITGLTVDARVPKVEHHLKDGEDGRILHATKNEESCIERSKIAKGWYVTDKINALAEALGI